MSKAEWVIYDNRLQYYVIGYIASRNIIRLANNHKVALRFLNRNAAKLWIETKVANMPTRNIRDFEIQKVGERK